MLPDGPMWGGIMRLNLGKGRLNDSTESKKFYFDGEARQSVKSGLKQRNR